MAVKSQTHVSRSWFSRKADEDQHLPQSRVLSAELTFGGCTETDSIFVDLEASETSIPSHSFIAMASAV